MLQEFELRLRTKLQQGSSEANLLTYLNSKDTLYTLKEMVMIPLMSYWLPLSSRSTSKESQKSPEQKQVIRNCIYRLKLHQQYLQEMIGEELVTESSVLATVNLHDDPVNNLLSYQESKPAVKDLALSRETTEIIPSPTAKEEWFNPFKR